MEINISNYDGVLDSAYGPIVETIVYKNYTIEVRKLEPESHYLAECFEIESSNLSAGDLTYHCEEISEMEFSLENIQEKIKEAISDQKIAIKRLRDLK